MPNSSASTGSGAARLSAPLASPAAARLHDQVAAGYRSDSGIIARKNRQVLESLAGRWPAQAAASDDRPLRIADLGVGDGALLGLLHEGLRRPLQLSGLDISPAMLRLAGARVPMTAVLGPAEQAAALLPQHSFDLLLSHYILAYVPLPALLEQAKKLLAPGGVLSLVSSTHEGAEPLREQYEQRLRGSWHPLRRWLARAIEQALASSSVPERFELLQAELEAAGLCLLERQTLRDPLVFRSRQEAFDFIVTEGWGASVLGHFPRLPLRCNRALVAAALAQCQYPMSWVHSTELLLIGRAPVA